MEWGAVLTDAVDWLGGAIPPAGFEQRETVLQLKTAQEPAQFLKEPSQLQNKGKHRFKHINKQRDNHCI